MNETSQIVEALRLDRMQFPSSPRIVRLDWDSYVDSSGEDALKVWVVLDDETGDREIERAPIHELKSQIIGSLRRQGVTLFPYFYFVRESELGALVEDD